jgi:hypothetical protein
MGRKRKDGNHSPQNNNNNNNNYYYYYYCIIIKYRIQWEMNKMDTQFLISMKQ